MLTMRKPATVGQVLAEEFMKPLGLTQAALAEAMGVPRKHSANCAPAAEG
jgi:plasmid maintenance system antidote protein VapI